MHALIEAQIVPPFPVFHPQSKMKTLFLLVCMSLFLLLSCRQKGEKEPSSAARALPLLCLEEQEGRTERIFPVTLQGYHSVDVRPLVRGRVIRMNWKEGDPVEEGQILFELDPEPCQAALKEAEASARAARVRYDDALLEYRSREILRGKGVVSEVELQHVHNRLASAQAEWEAAEARREQAATNLKNTRVESPLRGVAGMSPFRCGSLVEPQMEQALVTVSDTRLMLATLSLSEEERLSLMKNRSTLAHALRENCEVALLTREGKVLQGGEVDSISGIVDEGTGVVTVKWAFPNPDGALLHGASAYVRLTFVKPGSIVIPRAATFSLQDRTYVWVVKEGRAVSREIQTEVGADRRSCIVTSGLCAGESIIASGAGLVREGELIAPQRT